MFYSLMQTTNTEHISNPTASRSIFKAYSLHTAYTYFLENSTIESILQKFRRIIAHLFYCNLS